jgi:hypothetical protein
MDPVKKSPLGLVMNIVQSMGLDVTYAYDDLVFVDHNAFLLQMDKDPQTLILYFNRDSDAALRPRLTEEITHYAREHNLQVQEKGLFAIEQAPGEELKVTFF